MRARKFVPTSLMAILFVVCMFQACGYMGGPAGTQVTSFSSEAKIDFQTVRNYVFAPKCLQCHSGAEISGNYDLSSYASAIQDVVPGNPSASTLLRRLRDGTMPMGSSITEAEISLVETWIADGALESNSDVQTGGSPTPVPKAVDAGPDKAAILPVTNFWIFGSAADAKSVLWEKVSGPSVTMTGTNTLTLTLSNITAGTYVFKLTVVNTSNVSNSDTMQLVVSPVGTATPTPTPIPTPIPTATPTPKPSPTPSATPSSATYSSIYSMILAPKCLACHGATLQAGSYDLRTYASTLKNVVAKSSATSKLYIDGANGSMPKGGTPLSAAELNAIKIWIDAGALNN